MRGPAPSSFRLSPPEYFGPDEERIPKMFRARNIGERSQDAGWVLGEGLERHMKEGRHFCTVEMQMTAMPSSCFRLQPAFSRHDAARLAKRLLTILPEPDLQVHI